MRTIEWCEDKVRMIDQTRLPLHVQFIECSSHEEVAAAIRNMQIRGAPAIGVAAAFGVALAALRSPAASREELLQHLEEAVALLASTRPTAVNLFWALERMKAVAEGVGGSADDVRSRLVTEAKKMAEEDIDCNRRIGAWGSQFINDGDAILTHCNAGALATVGYGTALGVIRSAWEQGKKLHVFADETRPVLQGARLTAWELMQDGIPVTLITDNMAGYLMQQGRVSSVIVGADRIAANGDVANKIGTYSLAVLARAHGIPFYVAAPTSSIDLSLETGRSIVIEERSPDEVVRFGTCRVAPEGVNVLNPAFDMTPADLITAIITENGVALPPFQEALRRLVTGSGKEKGS